MTTVQGGSLIGTVVVNGAASSTGVCVEARSPSVSTTGYMQADASGAWRLRSLLPGDYLVKARPCDSSVNLADVWWPNGTLSSERQQVSVVPATHNGPFDMELFPGSTIEGIALGPDGTGVENVCVSTVNVADSLTGNRWTTSGVDGVYSITGLTSGDTRLYFNDCGDRDLVATTTVAVAPTAEATTSGIDVQLQQGGRVIGSVVAASGQPYKSGVVCPRLIDTSSGNYRYGGWVLDDGTSERVKGDEADSYADWMSASWLGSLIHATVGSFGGDGGRWRNRAGFAV